MYLPDINFWLALTLKSHAHNSVAAKWMKSAGRHSCFFCRVTQMGFLRLLTNRKAFPTDAVSMNQAWQVYDELLTDERIRYFDEPTDIDVAWRRMTQHRSFSTNVWTDAWLAAFAITADFELVTFDKGFVQFSGLRSVILS